MKITKALGCKLLVKPYKPKTQANVFFFGIDPYEDPLEGTGEIQKLSYTIVAGEVMLVGRGYRAENGEITPLEVKVGDKIVFCHQGSDIVKIELQNKEYWLIQENDIVFAFEE
ncbi:MAG: hypothetical protein KHZ77_04785 [Veillonella sp.]|uniref:hypothetical protein n=1 Tax=Veillonella sp. TaxID=1926307 RepID=UPI0025D61606|nr:hypothetical protein [Veillonella sp.]MBS4913463.1 hypothetical protein [Veillonella sp.]